MNIWVGLIVQVAILAALVGLLVWFIRVGRTNWRMTSWSAPNAALPVRASEASWLALLGLVLLALIGAVPDTGGMLLRLETFPSRVAAVHVILAIAMVIGVAAGVMTALWWRTWAGTTVAAVVLVIYGLLLSGPFARPGYLFGVATEPPPTDCTIELEEGIEGAEVWINGVYLGKTPVQMTLTEIIGKVPHWSEPPKDGSNENPTVYLPRTMVRGFEYERRRRWSRFTLPNPEMKMERGRWRRVRSSLDVDCYAAFRMGDDWGAGRGSGGGGGKKGNRFEWVSRFRVEFPERNRRLERLLDRLRAQDYRASDALLDAMVTYKTQGWNVLREATEREPQFRNVMDRWAQRRFGLDQVSDGQSAWSAFERICAEADRARRSHVADRGTRHGIAGWPS